MGRGRARRAKVRGLALIALAATAACNPSGGVGLAPSGGIGSDWKWNKDVETRVAGPYALCGAVGTGLVTSAATRPTAPEVAVSSRSGLVSFFSLDGSDAPRPAINVGGFASSVAYSGDGQRLVAASDAGVEVFDLADGRSVFSAQPFGFATQAAALSPDGSLVAALGQDHEQTTSSQAHILRLVSVADGKLVSELPNFPTDVFVAPQFSRDGARVLVGADVFSVPELQPLYFLEDAQAWTSALSPDGTMVASGGTVFDIASGRALKSPGPSSVPLQWVAFSPDGATYAESHEGPTGTTIQVFRTSDFSVVEEGVVDYPQDSGATPDGRFLFSGDGKHLVVTFDPMRATGSDLLVLDVLALPGLARERAIVSPRLFWGGPASFSPDGSLLAARLDTSTGVWRASDLAPLARIAEDADEDAFLGNGLLAPGVGSLYDPTDGRQVSRAPLPLLGVSPDGTMAVSVKVTNLQIEVVRLADLATTAVLDQASLEGLDVVIFSPDNRFIATAGPGTPGRTLTVFDAATGKTLMQVDGSEPIALSIAGATARLIGVAPGVNGVRAWSIPDGATLYDLEGGAAAVAASPEGSLIATGGGLGTLQIFSADTGALRQTILAHGHGDASRDSWWVSSVAFGQTGQLATVGVDVTMRLWCSP